MYVKEYKHYTEDQSVQTLNLLPEDFSSNK
jgi:hypothetical protein